MPPETLVRWRCAWCGEEVVAQEVDAVEHIRSTHHCPPAVPDPIVMALRGQYDG